MKLSFYMNTTTIMLKKGRIWLITCILLILYGGYMTVLATAAVSTTTTTITGVVNNIENEKNPITDAHITTLEKVVFSPFLRPLIKHHASLSNELELDQTEPYEKDLILYLTRHHHRHPIIFIPTFGGIVFKNVSNETAGIADCQSPSVLFQGNNHSIIPFLSQPIQNTSANDVSISKKKPTTSTNKLTAFFGGNGNTRGGNSFSKGGVGYDGGMNASTTTTTTTTNSLGWTTMVAPAGSLDLVYRESDGSFVTTNSNTTSTATIGVIEDGRLCGTQMISSENKDPIEDGYYVDHLMKKLVTHLNYTSDYDLLVYSYDYRLVADKQQLAVQYERLKAMIEAVYEVTHHRVHLVTHGMGGVYTLGFLNHVVNQTWKDLHIEHFVTISTPFHGTRRALEVLISGETLTTVDKNSSRQTNTITTTVDVAPAPVVYRVEKNNGALVWMLPRPVDIGDEVTGSPENTTTTISSEEELDDGGDHDHDHDNNTDRSSAIVRLGKFGTFTPSMADMKDLLMLIDESDYATIYEHHAERLWKLAELRYPNVSMSCIYGKGIATPFAYDYSIDVLVRREPANEVFMRDGDGVATLDSLSACRHWLTSALEHKRYMQIHELTGPNYEHTSILNSRELFNILAYEAFPLL